MSISVSDGASVLAVSGAVSADYGDWPVANAGNVNGDSFADFLTGAWISEPGGSESVFEVYVVFGSGAGFDAGFDPDALNGENGFVLGGIDADDYSNWSISTAGDINRDGIDDLLIAATGGAASQSYAIYGSRSGFDARLDFSDLDEVGVGVGAAGSTTAQGPMTFGSVASVSALSVDEDTRSDFNGDGTDDILWRNTETGVVALWAMDDGERVNSNLIGNVGDAWSMRGSGDFDDDGTDDVIWRNSETGAVAIWEMANGARSSSSILGAPGPEWSVEGAGDFDGDGTDDILWRNSNNDGVFTWEMDDGRLGSSQRVGSSVNSDWQVEGIGDFDGDGVDDILWRNTQNGAVATWSMDAGALESSQRLGSVGAQWVVEGIGDFDNDGTDDVLWRNTDNDTVHIWTMSNGVIESSSFLASIGSQWFVGAVGDFDGDETSDILWRNDDNGLAAIWEMEDNSRVNSEVVGSVGSQWETIDRAALDGSDPTGGQTPGANDDDGFQVALGQTLTISVAELLANDVATNGGDLTVIGANGALLDGDTIRFTPTVIGDSTFTYTIQDGSGLISTATVTVTVPNRDPNAGDDDNGYVARVGETLVIPVSELLGNDNDPDGEALSIVAVNGAGAVLNGPNVEFTPTVVGPTSFTYTLQDASGGVNVGTVSVSVPNRAPTAVDDDNGYVTFAGQTLVIPVAELLANDVDPDGEQLTVVDVNGVGAELNGANIQFTPVSPGAASFTYTVQDPSGAQSTATVSVNVPNRAPVATDDAGFFATFGEEIVIPFADLLSNDSDPDGEALSIVGVSGGAQIIGDTVVYTPSVSGVSSFNYFVADASGQTDQATVTVSTNQLPIAGDDSFDARVGETLIIPVSQLLQNDSEPDGEALTITAVSGDNVLLSGENVIFTPTVPGEATFTYTLQDAVGASVEATVTVSVENRAPIAGNDDNEYVTTVGQTLVIPVAELLANDSDPDGEQLTITAVDGDAVLNGANIEFTPTSTGAASFTYTVTDASGASAQATVSVQVPNRAPTPVDDVDFQVALGQSLTIPVADLLANDVDADNQALTVIGVAGAGASLDGSNVVFTPTTSGQSSFTYTVRDTDGATGTATVTVTVNVSSESFADNDRGVVVDLAAGEVADVAKVLTLGDSITEGRTSPGGWRPDLWDGLTQDRDLWVDFVGSRSSDPVETYYDADHEGVSSKRLSSIERDILSVARQEDYDVVLIIAGTNDILQEVQNGGTPVDPQDMLNILRTLDDENPNGLFFVQKIPPILWGSPDGNPSTYPNAVAAYNQALAGVVADAQAEGIDAYLVDSPLTNGDISNDQLHPSPQGDAKIAEAWLDAIDQFATEEGGTLNGSPESLSAGLATVVGSAFGDRLSGNGDANDLSGGGGDDWIEGRGGNDDLTGGDGRDQFVFGEADGNDTVTDFASSDDYVYLRSSTGASFDVTQQGQNAVLTFGSTTVTFLNTSAGQVENQTSTFDDDPL